MNKFYTDAGTYKDGKVVYSDKIVRVKTYYDKRVIEIKSIYTELDNLTFSDLNLNDLKYNNKKYNRKLKDVINDDFISNKYIYNINKAIELGIVDENMSLINYYVKITGLKNKKDFVHFCQETFKLMDKDIQ